MRYGEKPRACDLQEFAQERGIQLTMGQATREIRNYKPAARAPRAPRVRKTLHQNTAEVLAHRWVNNKYTANDCITFSKGKVESGWFGWSEKTCEVVAQIVRLGGPTDGVQLRYIKSVEELRKNDAARNLLNRIALIPNQGDLAKRTKSIAGIITRLFEADQPDAFGTAVISYTDFQVKGPCQKSTVLHTRGSCSGGCQKWTETEEAHISDLDHVLLL